MEARFITTLWLGIIIAGLILLSAFDTTTEDTNHTLLKLSTSNETLKKQAFRILETKCNTCHRKQNPFMVFKEKNIPKRAKKIYQMVYIKRRMPKGNEVRLTNEEYNQLKKWLFTQEIF